MKTKWFYGVGVITLGFIPALWMSQGCVSSIPAIATMALTPTVTLTPLPSDLVSNFETGSVTVNSTLLGINGYMGSFSVNTYGGSPANKLNNPFVVPNTIPDVKNNSTYALHMFGNLNTTAGTYESDQVVCAFLAPNPNIPPSFYYDLTPFTAIRLDVAFGNDTNSNRALAFPIDLTTPSGTPGGNCTSSCYAHYQVLLPSGTNTGWMPVTYTWAQFTQSFASLGTPFSSHLNKVIQLSETQSMNTGAAGVTSYTDIWMDNIQFLP